MNRILKKTGLFFLFLLTAVVCVFAVSLLSTVSADGSGYDFPDGAVPVSVTVNGRSALEGEAVIIDSVTYVPVRSFATLAGAERIGWDARTHTATVTLGGREVKITDGGLYISSEGRYFFTVERVLNINDRLFAPVRPLAATLGFLVEWDRETRTVELSSSREAFISGSRYYNSDDLYWLSRIIHAEAGGEPLEGKIAVGNVVLNRKASPSYPNTVWGVVFDRRGGTQFSPVAIGTIYKTPSAESIAAAKICLEGYTLSDRILFFMNPRIATNSWISRNRPYAFTIGNHRFYY